jgi:hypothetical protein
MRIHSFKFENKKSELKIESINFSNLSLLVGVSGVGKTIILQSLLDLKNIARGKSPDGVEWEIQFSIKNGDNYLWKGAFENTGIPELIKDILYEEETETLTRPKIIYEKLSKDNHLIIERKENAIKLEGKSTPKLSSYKSVLNLFNEEESISPVFESFNKIILSDSNKVGATFDNFDKLLKKHPTLESIQNANLSIYNKLALLYKNQADVFNTIKKYFINVFTQVEDIRFAPIEKDELPLRDKTLNFFIPYLQLKEKNVPKWISHNKMSSGMFKTLLQISQLFLCAEGTVLLIDEFENSLGINCIDALTENLIDDSQNIQFVLTSHHPYIINAIGMEYWKVVSRRGGVISTKDAKVYKLGNSRHEAFKQLIQLNDYRKGITY